MPQVRRTIFNTFIGMTAGLHGAYYQGSYPESEHETIDGSEIVYSPKINFMGLPVHAHHYVRGLKVLEKECLNIFLTTFTASLYTEIAVASKVTKGSAIPCPARIVSLAVFAHLFGRYRGLKPTESSRESVFSRNFALNNTYFW